MSAITADDFYLTPEELARRHRKTKETLANERSRGDGVAFVKAGGKVLYPSSAVLEAEHTGLTGFTWSRFENCLRECPDVPPALADKIIQHVKERLTR